MLLYVNSIVFTASNQELLQHTTTTLQQQSAMKERDPLHFIDILVE
jgi:hypothetical protein